MANQKKIVIVVIVLILGLFAVFAMSKGSQENGKNGLPENTVAGNDVFGILDMDKVFYVHPQYQQLDQLKKERDDIALRLEKTRPMQLDTALPTLDLATVDDAIRQKKNEKVMKKLNELNERLQKSEQAFRMQHSETFAREAKAIDDAYLPQIFNLQLKLETLSISQEAGMELQKQADALRAEHEQKISEHRRKVWTDIDALMHEEKTKAKAELDAYAADVEKQLVQEAKQQVDEQKARNHLAMADKSNELQVGLEETKKSREDLENKEKEITVLQERMVKDIADKVAKIAEENKLTVVLTTVQVNVNALDITDMVIKEFNQ